MEVGQIIKDVILGQIQPALNKVDKETGYQEFVDLTTLQMWRNEITEDIPVNLEHGFSFLSPLIPMCGVISKDSIKIDGDKLIGDFWICKEAFTEAMYFIGKAINDLLAIGKDKLMFSMQGLMNLAPDATKQLSMIRPIEVDSVALTKQGAATTQMTLSTKPIAFSLSASKNPELEKKLVKPVINNDDKGECKMAAETKKEEAPSVADVKDKVDATHDAVKDVKDKVAKMDADNDSSDMIMSAIAALHKDVKDLAAKHEALCASMSAKPAALSAETEAPKPVALAATPETPKVIEVKLSADVGNMSEAPAEKKAEGVSDEELTKDWKKYWYAKDKDYKPRIKELAGKINK